ncbi:MAG TPA: ribosomal protein S18-alanine N-acetyltransferase [Rhizomicrobium sp.]|nr:ribosomal protein S18-alanine N-acetyltransferase [Rhizomicrobium sp.]
MKPAIYATRDAALLAFVHARCFVETWDNRAFEDLLTLKNVLGFVASVEERPAGFIALRVAADEAEILSLGVLPERRRHGLARALLSSAAEHADNAGARTLFLEVDENNLAARKLYDRLGFAEVGRRSGYYRNCDSVADALVLRRTLPIPAWESR